MLARRNQASTTSPGDETYYGIYGLDTKPANLMAILLPKTVGEGNLISKNNHPLEGVGFREFSVSPYQKQLSDTW